MFNKTAVTTLPEDPTAGYRATDGPDEPGVPTFVALVSMWAERDAQYAALPRALESQQVEAIRLARLREVDGLPPADRAKAWARVKSWFPPEHGQGR